MISLPTYALAVGVDDEVCIADPWNSALVLCGRERQFLPGALLDQAGVHDVCLAKWRLIARRAA